MLNISGNKTPRKLPIKKENERIMKTWKKFSTALLAITVAVSCLGLFGCRDRIGPNEEKVDPKRTQLYVANYDGGFGHEWLDKAKARFEEAEKDKSYEEGKLGVQIIPFNSKHSLPGQTTNDVFFYDGLQYYDQIALGNPLDITDVVTTPLTEYGETKSIADKMTAQQREYYAYSDNNVTDRYYAVPHFEGTIGIYYDLDLFERESLYFAKDTASGSFVIDGEDESERSLGADGVAGTFDDGLPVTYDDFFLLCDKMLEHNVTPFSWTGAHQDYFSWLLMAFHADYEGREQMMLNYSFGGKNGATANNLVTVAGGTVTPQGPQLINNSTGYKLANQAGRYYALNWADRLLSNSNYYYNRSFSVSQTHLDAQQDFLYGSFSNKVETIGMLMEGAWWANEATAVFDSMVEQYGQKASRAKRRFGLMPFPKAPGASEGLTLVDMTKSLGYVSSAVPENRKAVAKQFIRFVNTDESLREFSVITDAAKALQYSLTAEDTAKMSYLGKQTVTLRETADVLYQSSPNPLFLNNEMAFTRPEYLWKWGTHATPSTSLKKPGGITAAEYFNGYAAGQAASWNNNYSKYFSYNT
jgi:hypothetical protein